MKKIAMIDTIVLGGLGLVCVLAFGGFAPSEGSKAETAYDAAKNSGASETQLCRSARAVQDAYAAEGDKAQEENWKGWATSHCLLAGFREGHRDLRLGS